MAFSQLAPVAYAAWQGSGTFTTPDVAVDCTVTRTGLGVYELTLTGTSAPQTNFCALASVSRGAVNANTFNIDHTSATVKTIRFTVPADVGTDDFYFTIGIFLAVRAESL